MSQALLPAWTLAYVEMDQRGVLRSITREFQERRVSPETTGLAAGVGLTLAIVAGAWWYSRYTTRHRRPQNSPRALFRELCREHGLEQRDRRALSKLARDSRLRVRAQIFLSPHCFEEARLPPAHTASGQRLRALGSAIFGETQWDSMARTVAAQPTG